MRSDAAGRRAITNDPDDILPIDHWFRPNRNHESYSNTFLLWIQYRCGTKL